MCILLINLNFTFYVFGGILKTNLHRPIGASFQFVVISLTEEPCKLVKSYTRIQKFLDSHLSWDTYYPH
jgi:hypothetical protein